MARASSPAWGSFITPVLLLPALLLGGGSTLGLEMDGWLSGLAIAPVSALLIAHFLGVRPMHRAAWPLLALVGGVLGLGLMQLFWASDGLWWSDASRADARTGLELAGVAAVGPWSLTPDDTRMFLLRWLPPLALLLAVAGASVRERHRTIALIGICAIIAAVLTMAQQVSPTLLPYIDETGQGIGWFANPNHHGLFLACGLAAALLWLPVAVRTTRRRATGLELSRPMILASGTVLVIGMATMLTGSRAALPLFLMALALAFLARPHQSVRPAWFTIGMVALPIVLALGLLVPRYLEVAFTGPSIAEDRRWAALPSILDGAWEAMPWGTGFGSFDQVYLGLEPTALLGDRALNEAHNELAQWLLEGGLGGLALMVLFVALLWTRGRARLRDAEADDLKSLRAGAIIVVLVAIHSLIDYPTRTVALGSLAMTALALFLIPPSETTAPGGSWKWIPVTLALLSGLAAPIVQYPFHQRTHVLNSPPDARGMAVMARNSAIENGAPDAVATEMARSALRRGPLEATAYEALALAAADDDLSNAFVDAGLALSRRAGVLPSLKFQRSLAAEDYDEAVEQALTLLRRTEPDPNFLQSVRLAALDDGFARDLGRQLEPRQHWVTPLFALADDAGSLETNGARQLLENLPRTAGGPPPHLVEPTLARLLDASRFEDALALYRRLYPERGALEASDYPNARTRTDNSRFDWRFASLDGLRPTLRAARLEISGRGRTDGPFAWRYLALTEGSYRLSVDRTGSGDGASVLVEVLCASGSVLARAEPQEGRTMGLDFTIDDGCPLALVRLQAIPSTRPYRIVLDQWRLERFPRR